MPENAKHSFVEGDSGSKYVAVCLDKETREQIKMIGTKAAKLRFWYGEDGEITVRDMIPRAAPNEHIVEYLFLSTELIATTHNVKLNLEVEIYDSVTLFVSQLEPEVADVRRKKLPPEPEP